MGKNIDIVNVMKLAKLNFEEAEIAGFDAELNKILDYINMLSAANTSKLEGLHEDLDYDAVVGHMSKTQSIPLLRQDAEEEKEADVCATGGFDFNVVKNDAPEFEPDEPDSDRGYFIVPAVIE